MLSRYTKRKCNSSQSIHNVSQCVPSDNSTGIGGIQNIRAKVPREPGWNSTFGPIGPAWPSDPGRPSGPGGPGTPAKPLSPCACECTVYVRVREIKRGRGREREKKKDKETDRPQTTINNNRDAVSWMFVEILLHALILLWDWCFINND